MGALSFYDLKERAGVAPSLSAYVASEVGSLIVSSAYQPGDLIEEEGALAERYQVSRSVIRDAVKILAGKGLLEVRRGIGTRVNERHNWGMFDDDVLAWSQSISPNAEQMMKLVEFRQMLEPQAARWAAERASDKAIETIHQCLLNMEENAKAGEKFVIADAHFHRAILQAADNEFVAGLEGVIFSALLSSIRVTNPRPGDSNPSIPYHRDVYDAIAGHQPDLAEKNMRILLEDAKRKLIDVFAE